ncbi:MAG: hypothetical protein JXA15_06835 [Spirochaetales bacterium]|nr:hypothetical protein [Spirochaetales bacterium]
MNGFLARGVEVPADAPSGDVAVRSAGILSRNLSGERYAWRADDAARARAAEKVSAAWRHLDAVEACPLAELDADLRRALAERDSITDSYSHDPGAWIGWDAARGAWLTANEQDHVRLRCERPGFDPEGVLSSLETIEEALSFSLGWAFDERFGFLGPDPAKLGHALVLSASFHLPALSMTLAAERVFKEALSAGVEIIGQSSDDGRSLASVWTLAFTCPPDLLPRDAAARLRKIGMSLVEAERAARSSLVERDPLGLEDAVSRAFGLSRYALALQAGEAAEAASFLRLGDALGLVAGFGPGLFASLLRGLSGSGLSLSGIAPDRPEARRRALAFAEALGGVSLVQEKHRV